MCGIIGGPGGGGAAGPASAAVPRTESVAVYEAKLGQFRGSGVSGYVVVFRDDAGYLQIVTSVDGLGVGADCSGADTCGQHIQNGVDCNSIQGQGGHLLNSVTGFDPWTGLGVLQSPAPTEPVMLVVGASHHAWTHPADTIVQKSVADAKAAILSQVKQWLVVE